MTANVLVLNADYTMLEIVTWQQAVSLLVLEKVRLVEEYAGRMIRSASTAIPFPAVVVRTKYVEKTRRIRFSRKNILARDAYTCQYCGAKPRKRSGIPNLQALTIDHVVPRAHKTKDGRVTLPWNGKSVRVTCWENIATACEPCNRIKADRTPKQAGLRLRQKPRPPNAADVVWMSIFRHEVPDEWKLYLPTGSPWSEYWDVELDDS